jgi:putative membrane protein
MRPGGPGFRGSTAHRAGGHIPRDAPRLWSALIPRRYQGRGRRPDNDHKEVALIPQSRIVVVAAALAMAVALPISPLYPQDNNLKADRDFIRQAAASNWLEIRLGELARDKAANSSVKQFGERMVIDHTNLQSQLNSLTRNDGDFRPRLNQLDLDEVKRFQRLSGAEFDKAYMTSMIRHHEKDVSLFQNQGRSARSAQVQNLAAGALPVLQQHLTLARQIAPQAGITTGDVAVATPGDTARQPARADNSPWANVKPPRAGVPRQQSDTAAYRPDTALQRGNTQVTRDDLKQGAARQDAEFIRDAVADNYLETRLGDLAARKARDRSVRDYARMVANDRESMQDRWIRMADRNGLNIKPGMGPRHRDKLERLEKLSGEAFDRAYMTMQVQNNEDYRTYFEKEGRAAHSSDVRELVQRDLPTLREHTNLSRQVSGRIGVNTEAALRARQSAAYRE